MMQNNKKATTSHSVEIPNYSDIKKNLKQGDLKLISQMTGIGNKHIHMILKRPRSKRFIDVIQAANMVIISRNNLINQIR